MAEETKKSKGSSKSAKEAQELVGIFAELAKSMESFSQQSSASLLMIDESMKKFSTTGKETLEQFKERSFQAAKNLEELNSSSNSSSQGIGKLTDSMKDLAKAEEKASKEAGFKKGGDGKNNIFEQMGKSSKVAKLGVIALGGAFSLLGKAIKGITSIVGTVFDLIGSGLGMIKSFIGGIIDFVGDTFSALAEQSNTMKDRMFEQAVALEKVKETFGDTSKGAGKAMLDFTATAVGMYSPTALRQIFGSAAEAGEYALNLLNAGAESSILLRDQIKENAKEIIVFSKAIGMTVDEFEAMKLNAIATGQSVVDMQKDILKYSQGFAKRLGLDAKLLAKNVLIAQKDVKHFANVTIKEMTQAAAYANKLGLSLEKITGIMDAFDTFETAANNVSKLSQAFGVNLDTMKLLEANTPDEQLAQIKDAFNAAGKSAANMNRHELSLIASMLHLDEATVKAALSAENQGASLEDIKDAGSTMEKQMLSTSQAMKTSMDEIAMSLKKLERNSTGFFDAFLDGLAEGVIESGPMKGLLANLAQALDTVFLMGRKLGDIIVKTFPGIKDMLAGLAGFFDPKKIGDMFGGFNRVFEKFFKNLQNGTGNVKDLFGDLFNEIKSYFSSQGSNGQKFLSGASDFWNAIKQIIATAILGIGELIADGLSFIADLLEGKKTLNTGGLAAAAGKGVDKLKKEFSPIGEAFTKSFEKIGPQFNRIFDQISQRLDAWWQKTKRQISDWWEKFDLLDAIMKNPGTATVLTFLIGGKVLDAAGTIANIASVVGKGLSAAAEGSGGLISKLASGFGKAGPIGLAAVGLAAIIYESFSAASKFLGDPSRHKSEAEDFDKSIKRLQELKKEGKTSEAADLARELKEKQLKVIQSEKITGIDALFSGEQLTSLGESAKARADAIDKELIGLIGSGSKTKIKEAADTAAQEFGKTLQSAYTEELTDIGLGGVKPENLTEQLNQFLIETEREFNAAMKESNLSEAKSGSGASFGKLGDLPIEQQMENVMHGALAGNFKHLSTELQTKLAYYEKFKGGERDKVKQLISDQRNADREFNKSIVEEQKAEEERASREAGKKMMEEAAAVIGPTTVDNVEERIKKIQEIGAKVAGGKEEFNKNMETLRKNLSEMNFSLFDKSEDRDKFAKMLGDSTAISAFLGAMDKVFVGIQAFGDKAIGIGSVADSSSIMGRFATGMQYLSAASQSIKIMFAGGPLDNGQTTKGLVKGLEERAVHADIANATNNLNLLEASLYLLADSIDNVGADIEKMKLEKIVSSETWSNLSTLGILLGSTLTNEGGQKGLVDLLGTPADLTSTSDAVTKWSDQASKIFDALGESLKKMDEKLGSVEAIKSKIQSISELRQQLDNAMESLQTEQKITVPYSPSGTGVTAAQPTPSRIQSGGTQITLKFDIVMDSKSLEKTLVTRSDSIVVKALTGLAEGTNKTVVAYPGNEIAVATSSKSGSP